MVGWNTASIGQALLFHRYSLTVGNKLLQGFDGCSPHMHKQCDLFATRSSDVYLFRDIAFAVMTKPRAPFVCVGVNTRA